jgi:hypothetical protein
VISEGLAQMGAKRLRCAARSRVLGVVAAGVHGAILKPEGVDVPLPPTSWPRRINPAIIPSMPR